MPSIVQLYDISGQVAIVTGAGQGIGFGIASRLAAAGAAVVINDIDPTSASSAVERLQKPGVKLASAVGDVSQRADVQRILGVALAAFGRVDILINNAGIFPRRPFLEMAEEEWDRVMAVNLRGPFLCSQAVSRQMIAQGRGGKILNISSGAGLRGGSDDLIAYSTSKAGLLLFTRVLALSLAPYRIRVNAIAPGSIHTEGSITGPKIAVESIPLGRRGRPDDIARTALFLVSDMAEYITGITLPTDGGTMAR